MYHDPKDLEMVAVIVHAYLHCMGPLASTYKIDDITVIRSIIAIVLCQVISVLIDIPVSFSHLQSSAPSPRRLVLKLLSERYLNACHHNSYYNIMLRFFFFFVCL